MKEIFGRIKRTLKNYKPPKFLIIATFISMALFVFFQRKSFDNDTWFLLNHGRYVFGNGIPHIEPFTMHVGFKFIMQQWLTACIFWLLYKSFQMLGLKLLIVCVYSLTMYFMYRLCMLVSDKKFYLSSIITIVFSILLQIQMVLRPQIFDNLMFVIELYILELYVRKKNYKYLIALPILSLLLINLHASMWFMFIAFMIPYIIDSFRINLKITKGEGYNKKPLLIVLIFVLLAGFINPYGIDAITYIFRSYGIKAINKYIIEMEPAVITDLFGIIIFSILLVVIGIYIFSKQRNIKLRYILLFLGTTFLGLSHIRNIILLLIGCLFPLADYLSSNFNEYNRKYNSKSVKTIYNFLFIAVISLALITVYKPIEKPKSEVSNSVDYIIKKYDTKDLKIYTSYNDGGYLEYMGFKPYLDARAEVFLKKMNKREDIFYEYCKVRLLNGNGADFLEKYKFDLLILDKYDNLKNYKDKLYKLVYKDKYREVYELKKE